jgi:all-trans-retinol 13,14-reductase
MQRYDAVIIGSGLAGMLSAVFLAREGMRVALIEQNKQLGGCLQSFSFQKKVFDSCVHYLGSLEEGQTQDRIFRYAGIRNDLRMKRLEIDGFDRIIQDETTTEFPLAQGMDNFCRQLSEYFPQEQQSILRYTTLLQEVASCFPLFNLRNGDPSLKDRVSSWELANVIQSIGSVQLQRVLTGNSLLYAGCRHSTPFYVHSLVNKSYIDSAYKCEGGSSQIALLLLRQLRSLGADVFRREEVIRLHEEGGLIRSAHTASGLVFEGRQFIANVHPAKVMDWIDSRLIKNVYRNRVRSAGNSVSAFMVNIVLEPGSVVYPNSNVYWNRGDSLHATSYLPEHWPVNYAIYYNEDKARPGFAETVSLLSYMHADETTPWWNTRNITAAPRMRSRQYDDFKETKAEQLLNRVAERYPEIKANMRSIQVATPLTFRDYMGSPDGSMYGIMADIRQPAASRIPVRTKIPNLLLTGQNIGLHGVLGVSINAVAVSGELLGLDYLLGRINRNL